MKKLFVIFGTIFFIGIVFFLYITFYHSNNERKERIELNNYINDTSVIDEDLFHDEVIEENATKITNKINYKAILEIPKINLKKGLVDVTKDFKSINYAISIDKHSNYPDEYGNLILYAHSGSSSFSFFNKLYKLEKSNLIYVYYNGTKYTYQLFEHHLIDKTGKANILQSNDSKYITLITCSQQEKDKQIVLIGEIINEEQY